MIDFKENTMSYMPKPPLIRYANPRRKWEIHKDKEAFFY